MRIYENRNLEFKSERKADRERPVPGPAGGHTVTQLLLLLHHVGASHNARADLCPQGLTFVTFFREIINDHQLETFRNLQKPSETIASLVASLWFITILHLKNIRSVIEIH